MIDRLKGKIVDFRNCSKLRLYSGNLGTHIESEFRLEYDGDVLQLISIYDGKCLGHVYLNKEDAIFLKGWLAMGVDTFPSMVEKTKKGYHFKIPQCDCGGLGIKDKNGWYCASCKVRLK